MFPHQPWDPSAGNFGPAFQPIPVSSKLITREKLPDVIHHTSRRLNETGDEYLPNRLDLDGEQKFSDGGHLSHGREYRCRTFHVSGRGTKLFMLATECATSFGYRDSYFLFKKHRSLFEIVPTQAERDDLVHRKIVPYSYRSRHLAIVTARSMFRHFDSRMIINGRRVRDDYWENRARAQGFTEHDSPGEKLPGAARAKRAAVAEASHAGRHMAYGITGAYSGKLAAVNPTQPSRGLIPVSGNTLTASTESFDHRATIDSPGAMVADVKRDILTNNDTSCTTNHPYWSAICRRYGLTLTISEIKDDSVSPRLRRLNILGDRPFFEIDLVRGSASSLQVLDYPTPSALHDKSLDKFTPGSQHDTSDSLESEVLFVATTLSKELSSILRTENIASILIQLILARNPGLVTEEINNVSSFLDELMRSYNFHSTIALRQNRKIIRMMVLEAADIPMIGTLRETIVNGLYWYSRLISLAVEDPFIYQESPVVYGRSEYMPPTKSSIPLWEKENARNQADMKMYASSPTRHGIKIEESDTGDDDLKQYGVKLETSDTGNDKSERFVVKLETPHTVKKEFEYSGAKVEKSESGSDASASSSGSEFESYSEDSDWEGPDLESRKMFAGIVARLLNLYNHRKNSLSGNHGLRQCVGMGAGSTEVSENAVATGLQSGRSSSNGKKAKGKRKREDNDSQSQDEDNGERRQRGLRKDRSDDGERLPLLACPFFKRNGSQFAVCGGKQFDNTSRVKYHIKRAHQPPIHCERCFTTFTSCAARSQHSRRPVPCSIRPPVTWIAVTEEMKIELSKKTRKRLSTSEAWYEIYHILFPGLDDPDSPYFEGPEAEELRQITAFVALEGPQVIASIVPEHLRMQVEQPDIMRWITQNLFGQILQRWEMEQRATSQQEAEGTGLDLPQLTPSTEASSSREQLTRDRVNIPVSTPSASLLNMMTNPLPDSLPMIDGNQSGGSSSSSVPLETVQTADSRWFTGSWEDWYVSVPPDKATEAAFHEWGWPENAAN